MSRQVTGRIMGTTIRRNLKGKDFVLLLIEKEIKNCRKQNLMNEVERIKNVIHKCLKNPLA
ncbi:hypothetical protein COI83_14075 [Bacillus cereus]|nr:hypothetical protein COI83_14075 [Bacillus cereus]